MMGSADTRLPAKMTLGPVHLTVIDRDETSAFYQDVLGFRVAGRDDDRVLLSATGEPPISLILSGRPTAPRHPGSAGTARQSPGRRSAGLYHFAVLLPTRADLARALRHLLDVRTPIEGASDHGVSEAIYLHDPEGNGIEIYADRPRDQWPRRGDVLAMFTQALDVDDLLAADPAPWTGLPPGTRIGHIHLHVADLARAERFYAGVLGFEVTVRGYPGALFLATGGYHHHIGLNTWAGNGISPADSDAAGLRYFTVHIPDPAALDGALRRVREAGSPVEEVPGGPVPGTLVRDPDGIGVLLAGWLPPVMSALYNRP